MDVFSVHLVGDVEQELPELWRCWRVEGMERWGILSKGSMKAHETLLRHQNDTAYRWVQTWPQYAEVSGKQTAWWPVMIDFQGC